MTQLEFNKATQDILVEFRRGVEADVRRRWREEQGIIFVRQYTVKAHVYRRPGFRKRRHLESVAA